MKSLTKIALVCLISSLVHAQNPIVFIDLPALLGNRLWGFSVAKIIAYELGYNLHCKSIYGFPNTYRYTPHYKNNRYRWELYQHDQIINIPAIINNKALRNIKLRGYFQNIAYIEKYADIIRNDWLKIDPALLHTIDKDDIVAHIRFHVGKSPMSFDYYEKALAMANYKQLYLCTDEPKHPFIRNFDTYNPIMVSTREFESYASNTSWDDISKMNMEDFGFIASFNKIIISHSTYSWWAAYLSHATEIYAPYCKTGGTHYGKVNEARYIYIDTHINY